jgi:hypothetical protein
MFTNKLTILSSENKLIINEIVNNCHLLKFNILNENTKNLFEELISSYKTLNYYDEIFKQKFKKAVSQEFVSKNTSLNPEEWHWDKHNKIRNIGIVRSKISASIQCIEICFNDIANSVDNFSYLFHKEFYETLTLPSNITIVLRHSLKIIDELKLFIDQ